MPNLGIQGLTLIEHKSTDMEEAQRKITDYYKNDKKTITRNDHKTRHTARQETNERHTNKTRNTRQSATSANHAKP
jgi:hypothetical protein